MWLHRAYSSSLAVLVTRVNKQLLKTITENSIISIVLFPLYMFDKKTLLALEISPVIHVFWSLALVTPLHTPNYTRMFLKSCILSDEIMKKK